MVYLKAIGNLRNHRNLDKMKSKPTKSFIFLIRNAVPFHCSAIHGSIWICLVKWKSLLCQLYVFNSNFFNTNVLFFHGRLYKNITIWYPLPSNGVCYPVPMYPVPNKNGRNHYTQLAFFNSTTPTNKVFWPSKILLVLQIRIEKCTFEENYDAFVIFTMCRSLWQTRLNENWMAKETSMVYWIQMLK